MQPRLVVIGIFYRKTAVQVAPIPQGAARAVLVGVEGHFVKVVALIDHPDPLATVFECTDIKKPPFLACGEYDLVLVIEHQLVEPGDVGLDRPERIVPSAVLQQEYLDVVLRIGHPRTAGRHREIDLVMRF